MTGQSVIGKPPRSLRSFLQLSWSASLRAKVWLRSYLAKGNVLVLCGGILICQHSFASDIQMVELDGFRCWLAVLLHTKLCVLSEFVQWVFLISYVWKFASHP